MIHRVSVSARCQANSLAFTRRSPGAALSAHWYALITNGLNGRLDPKIANICKLELESVCEYCNIFNTCAPGARFNSSNTTDLKKVQSVLRSHTDGI